MKTSTALKILGSWGALMSFAYWRSKEQDKTGDDRSKILLKRGRSWKDSSILSWCIENGSCWIIAILRLAIFRARFTMKTTTSKMINMIGTTLLTDRLVQLFTKLASENVYSDIPHFSNKFVPKLTLMERLKEFFNLTVVSSVLVSSIIVYFNIGSPPEAILRKKMNWSLSGDLRKFRPIQFCAKLAIARCVVDVLFWVGHRIIHDKRFYAPIHKFHHEHRNPRTLTNQHFTIADFFIEALVPLVTAIQSLRAMSISISPLEEALLGAYVVWLEAASHCGKPLPCSSMVAPLAPLYNHVFGNHWDRRNVEFHQTHHEILKCNYSITQWPDRLLGTLQWNRDRAGVEKKQS